MPGQYFENPHNYSILQALRGQTDQIKPSVGMPPSPVPQTGDPKKDMLLAMLLYAGLNKAGNVPRATFSNAKPPTKLGYPANDAELSPSLGAGLRAGVLADQNPGTPEIRGRIPEPGNLNTPPAGPNGGLPPNQTPGIHNAVLDMLRKFIPGQ